MIDIRPTLAVEDTPPRAGKARQFEALRKIRGDLMARLVSCWSDPLACEFQAAAFRGRQYHAALMAMVTSGLGNVFTVLALTALFWDKASPSAFIVWVTAVSLLAGLNAWLGWSRRHVKVPVAVARSTYFSQQPESRSRDCAAKAAGGPVAQRL